MTSPLSAEDVASTIGRALRNYDTDYSFQLIPVPDLPGASLLEVTRMNGIVDSYSVTVVEIDV